MKKMLDIGLLVVIDVLFAISLFLADNNKEIYMPLVNDIGVVLLMLLIIAGLGSIVLERLRWRYEKTRDAGKGKIQTETVLLEVWLTTFWVLIMVAISSGLRIWHGNCTPQQKSTETICGALKLFLDYPVVILSILFIIVLHLLVWVWHHLGGDTQKKQGHSETSTNRNDRVPPNKNKHILCIAGITFLVVLGIAVLVAALTADNADYHVGIAVIIGLLWLGGKFTWWQYEKTRDATGQDFQKEKVRLEVWLATFGALVVAGIFAGLQFLHDERIADRQDYRISIDFLSSGSPAVRQKGVEDLYDYAIKNNDEAKEIWNLLNDHVKYFTRDKSYQESFPNEPASDIALILNIQSSKGYINQPDYPFTAMLVINWEAAWLKGADLVSAQLQGTHLREVQLQGAFLNNAQLQGATLNGSQLQAAHLRETQLQGAFLKETQLQGADLQEAQLQGVDLQEAQLQGVDLQEAQLQGADLRKAQLQGAYLWKTQLQEANLGGILLQGAFTSNHTASYLTKNRNNNKQPWFKVAISNRVNKDTALEAVVFNGGMTKEHLSKMAEQMKLDAEFWKMTDSKKALQNLLKKLETSHTAEVIVGKDIPELHGTTINDYLRNKEATVGLYIQEEADVWFESFRMSVGSNNNQDVFDLTIRYYNKAIELDSKDAYAYKFRGDAYYNKGTYDLAMQDYNKAIKLSPNHASYYNNRAITYRRQDKNDLAIQDYNKAIELNPNYSSAYFNRGTAYRMQDRYDLAMPDYDKAIELDPNNYALYYNKRGNAYDEQGQYDLAIQDYNKAIMLDPNNALPYNNRGFTYAKQNKYDLAIQDYNKAMSLFLYPKYAATGHINRGDAYFKKNEYSLAIQDYDKAIGLKPEYAFAYYKRGLSHLILKQSDAAKKDLTIADRKRDDIAEKFHEEQGSLEEFEDRYDITVPDDIRELLESSDSSP